MKHGILVLTALLAAGCAQERYVLLPNDGGEGNSVVVTPRSGKSLTLDKPYATARSRSAGVEASSIEAVAERFGGALGARPVPPKKFTLYFLEGTDEFTPASKIELDGVLAEIRRRPAPDIKVVGHTDRVGSVSDNDRLALVRARKVQAELSRLGIPPEAIQASGRGEREPVKLTDDEVAEPLNRRVEIQVR